MRAKFVVDRVTNLGSENAPCEELVMRAVTDADFDKDGNSEDNSFSQWTPTGDLSMTVTNPNLIGTIKEGEKYYLDFTKADA